MNVHTRTIIRPTARELHWFAHINRHGPQSSEFLYELTKDTHRCKDTALRRLQALREANYLRLPPQQRQISKAEFNPYVYDLTRAATEALVDAGLAHDDVRPTGHWWHGFWVSATTSAIELHARTLGKEYIPARRILDLAGAEFAIPTNAGKLIPDQLFAIRSADGYRVYLLEVDRATEPVRSSQARKSLQRSHAQYAEILRSGRARSHFGLSAPVFALWVFNSKRRCAQFADMVAEGERAFRHGFLLRCVGQDFPRLSNLRSLL